MRSDIVFNALQTNNRFELCHQTFKAIRLLHKNNTRIEDTANTVLMHIAGSEPKNGPKDEAAEKPSPERLAPPEVA
jgi:hypothetical protein